MVLSYPTVVNINPVSQKLTEGHSESGHPIPTDVGYEFRIFITISKAFYAGEKWEFSPKVSEHKYICDETYRFYMAILAYYESDNPVIKPEELFSIILKGAEGIVWLKKVRSYAVIRSMGGEPESLDPDDLFYYEEAKRFNLTDIGDFFNVRYWFFWDQPDDNAWEAAFLPLKQDEVQLNKFKECLEGMLPDILLESVLEEEILLDTTSSSALDSKSDKTYPHWHLKQTDNYFSNKPLRGKGSYIQKCPGDTRFSFTLPVPQSNSVKLIEKQVAMIAAEMPWSCYTGNHDEYFKTYRKFGRGKSFFYCRDIKKDGLTKNRRLVQIVLDCLEIKYPGLPAWKYKGIFSDFFIKIGDEWKNPPRGVGLGMSAAITTIIQSVVFRMNLDRLMENDWLEGSVDAIFYHDDTAMGSDSEETLEDLMDIDYETCISLGIPVTKRKCFRARSYVLCENYSNTDLDKKESYQRTIIKSIHACENAAHAKFSWLSQFRFVEPEYWGEVLGDLVAHFGYEFYPEEANAPALVGGWVPYSYNGVDISLFVKNEPITKKEVAASLANRLHSIKIPGRRKFGKDKYRAPVYKVMPFVTNFGPNNLFLTDMTNQQVSESMTKLDRIGRTRYYWQCQAKLRGEEFKKHLCHTNITSEEWIDRLQTIHPLTDILPPEGMLTFETVDHIPIVERLYSPPNRKMSYLKSLNMDTISDKIVPWPVPPDIRPGNSLNLTAFERTKVKLEGHLFARWTQDLREIQLESIELRAINSDQWFNPNAVLAFISNYKHRLLLPIYKPRKSIVTVSDELFNKVNQPGRYNLWPYLVSRLTYNRVKDLDLTYFEEGIDKLLQKKRLLHLKEIKAKVEKDALENLSENSSEEQDYEVRSDMSFTDASLNDWDFFTWRTSKKNYLNWRNHYFNMLEAIISNMELARSGIMNDFSNYNQNDMPLDDPVCRHLYLESGGLLDDNNVPILDRGIDESGDAPIDIFDEPSNDSDPGGSSDGGLMEGW